MGLLFYKILPRTGKKTRENSTVFWGGSGATVESTVKDSLPQILFQPLVIELLLLEDVN